MNVQALLPYIQLALNTCSLIAILFAFYKFTRKPQDTLEQRVTALEVKQREHDEALHHGNDRFRELKEASTLIITSLIALIEFEMDYCMHHGDENISDGLMEAKNELYHYLAHK